MLDHNYQNILQIQKGDIVLDVGASEGLFADSILDSAKYIILIEPSSFYRNMLKEKYKNNSNIFISDKAAWKKADLGKLYLRGWGTSLIIDGDMCSYEGIEEVKTDTLDHIISSLSPDLKIDRIDFMKMDIEGAEIEALEGAIENLNSKKIKKMVIACYHYRKDGTQTWKWVKEFLKSKGYNIVVTEDKLLHAWI